MNKEKLLETLDAMFNLALAQEQIEVGHYGDTFYPDSSDDFISAEFLLRHLIYEAYVEDK